MLCDLASVRTPADIAEVAALAREYEGELRFTEEVPLGFLLYWLREDGCAALSSDLGLKVATSQEIRLHFSVSGNLLALVSLDSDRWLRLRIFKRRANGFNFASAISVGAQAAGSLHQSILTAVEKKYRAELSCRYQACSERTPLFDGSFAFVREGLEAYRKALGGQLCGQAGAHVRVRRGVLTHDIRRQSDVELHLPFLSRREWDARREGPAKTEIEGEAEGRLLLFAADAPEVPAVKNSYQATLALAAAHAPGFTLAYSDRRTLQRLQVPTVLTPMLQAYGFDDAAGQWLADLPKQPSEIKTSLTLSIPGELAAAWWHAPRERERDFKRTWARVSVAVQRAMRRWIPFVYFSDLNQYDMQHTAYPLLVYQCSRPFPGKGCTEFTYDMMNKQVTAKARRAPATAVAREIRRVQRMLIAAGKRDTARWYVPKHARKIRASAADDWRTMDALLHADSVFVEQLIQLGGRCGMMPCERATVRELAQLVGGLMKVFHCKLKRLYNGREFLSFGSLLLIEATSALAGAPIDAVLSIEAGGISQTFVNKSFGKGECYEHYR